MIQQAGSGALGSGSLKSSLGGSDYTGKGLTQVTQLADDRAGVRTWDTGLFSVTGIPKASR